MKPFAASATLSSVEAECALIGAVFVNPDAYEVAAPHVSAEDFGDQLNRLIWETIGAFRQEGQRVDPFLVVGRIGDASLGEITLEEYLIRLMRNATTVLNAPDYARLIHERAKRRRLLETAQRMAEWAVIPSHAPEITAEEGISALTDIAASRDASLRRMSLGEAAREARTAALEAYRLGRKLRGATWGVTSLDRMTLGLRPGNLVILAGRTGMGKTSLALAAALKAAHSGAGVYYVSIEMEAPELGERALSAVASSYQCPVPYHRIAKGDLNEAEFEALEAAQGFIDSLPLEIEQEPGLSIPQITARARHVAGVCSRKRAKLGVIFVDHLGLVDSSSRYQGNKVAETEEVSRGLKGLAKRLGVCVVALCQISRGVEGRDDKRPTLADLRWSGSIEQDADLVIGLYREAYYLGRKRDLTEEETDRLIRYGNLAEAEILKQRGGPTGLVQLYCDVATNVVSDWEDTTGRLP